MPAVKSLLWDSHLGSGPGMARHLVVIRAGHMRAQTDTSPLPTCFQLALCLSWRDTPSLVPLCPEG